MNPTADVTLGELVRGINGAGRCGSFHPNGCHIGLVDGSVRFIPNDIDANALRAVGTRDGGEVTSL